MGEGSMYRILKVIDFEGVERVFFQIIGFSKEIIANVMKVQFIEVLIVFFIRVFIVYRSQQGFKGYYFKSKFIIWFQGYINVISGIVLDIVFCGSKKKNLFKIMFFGLFVVKE